MEKQAVEISSLIGGLDSFVNPTEIDDNASPDCENVLPEGKSAIRTRLGAQRHGGEITNGYSGQGYFTYVNSSGVIEELVIVNGVLKRKNGSSWDTISGGTYSTTARCTAAQLGDRLYIADGVTALSYYNGTSILTTGVADAPLPSIVIAFGRRLYANNVNQKDRIYFGGSLTDTGAADNTGNFASTSPAYGGYLGFGRGKEVTAMAKQGSVYLIVGLKDGIERISVAANTGESTALSHQEELISNSIGIANHFTVDNVENDLGFLSWSDYYLLGEVASFSSLRTRNISNKITKTIKGISNSMLSKACAIYSTDYQKILLAYAEGTTYNNNVLVYDTKYKSWWKISNWSVAGWAEFVDGSNNRYLNFVSDNPSDSYCYTAFSGADDAGTPISWYWYSKIFNIKGFDILKKFKRWAALFGPTFGTISVSIYIDDQENTSSLTLGTPTLTTSGFGSMPYGWKPYGQYTNDLGTALDNISNDWRWKKLNRPNQGTKVQFKFAGSGTNEAGQIEKVKVYFIKNEKKKDRDKRIT